MLEIGWTVVPFLITMVIFVWGASVYFAMASPPAETLNIYVVGKQWMWKFQHLDGQREINELHVPVGRNVKLITTSEDVIHDLFVPAFRIKADVLPGRYVNIWFHATKPGRYHLFCAEYCGTRHSGMIGEVVVMEANEYQEWLSGGAAGGIARVGGREAVRRSRLQHLSPPGLRRPRPGAQRPVRQDHHHRGRRDGRRRRGLHPRIDPESEREGRGRLSADHADVPGAGHRRGAAGAHRVRQVAPRRLPQVDAR